MTTIRALAYGPHQSELLTPASFAKPVKVLHGYVAFPRVLPDRIENLGSYAAIMEHGDTRARIAGELAELFPHSPDEDAPVFIDMEHWMLPADASDTEKGAFRQWVPYVRDFIRQAWPKATVFFDGETLSSFDNYPAWLYPPADDLGRMVRKYSTLKWSWPVVSVVTNWGGGVPGAALSDDAFALQMLVAKLMGGEVWCWAQCDTPEQAKLSSVACQRVAEYLEDKR